MLSGQAATACTQVVQINITDAVGRMGSGTFNLHIQNKPVTPPTEPKKRPDGTCDCSHRSTDLCTCGTSSACMEDDCHKCSCQWKVTIPDPPDPNQHYCSCADDICVRENLECGKCKCANPACVCTKPDGCMPQVIDCDKNYGRACDKTACMHGCNGTTPPEGSPAPEICSCANTTCLQPTTGSGGGGSGGDPQVKFERDLDTLDDDWQPITGAREKALPGQLINLRVTADELPSGTVLTDFEWVLPPSLKVFKNYKADQIKGELIPLDSADKDDTEISFYFANSGTKQIRLRYKKNGTATESATVILVHKPTATIVPKTGTTQKVGPYLKLYSNGSSIGGIDFEGKVTLPSGWAPGECNWVQIVTPFRESVYVVGGGYSYSKNGQTLLDKTYPYLPRPIGSHPGGIVGNFSTGVQDVCDDSPGTYLPTFPATQTVNDQFKMYLMFKPDGVESRYVPVSCIDWSWSATVSSTDGTTWIVPPTPPNVGTPSEPTSHPTWNDAAP